MRDVQVQWLVPVVDGKRYRGVVHRQAILRACLAEAVVAPAFVEQPRGAPGSAASRTVFGTAATRWRSGLVS